MTSTASTTSPGNEVNESTASGEIHYLVFSPKTPPLSLENALPPITSAVMGLTLEASSSLDLFLRVSDPNQVHRAPDVDFWLVVRVYPERASFRVDGNDLTFNGVAFKLTAGEEGNDAIPCTASIKVLDLPAGVPIGEATLTLGGL